MRAYVTAIRQQPALPLTFASFAFFSAAYLTDHSAVQWLILVAVTWIVGFPLGYVIWRYRR